VVVTGKTISSAKQPSPTGSGATANVPRMKHAPESPRVGVLSSRAASVRRPASAMWATPARPVWRCGQAAVGRAYTVHAGRARLGPRSHLFFFKKIIFYFSFGFNLNSNLKNLYLNIQSTKKYEISSVGFIIF
jgi:hypothetical protein